MLQNKPYSRQLRSIQDFGVDAATIVEQIEGQKQDNNKQKDINKNKLKEKKLKDAEMADLLRKVPMPN
tara:strand:- start:480 stop:683 length:204 start_codon:yes stop_codon:yes gene_type:complete